MNELEMETIMGLIINSGNAKNDAMEAIDAAKQGNFDEAKLKIASAENSLIEAHHAQTAMLTEEAKGNHAEVRLLTVHSQDHLMTSIAVKDLAVEIVEVYQKIAEVAKASA